MYYYPAHMNTVVVSEPLCSIPSQNILKRLLNPMIWLMIASIDSIYVFQVQDSPTVKKAFTVLRFLFSLSQTMLLVSLPDLTCAPCEEPCHLPASRRKLTREFLVWSSSTHITIWITIRNQSVIIICYSYYGNSHVIRVIISLLNFLGIFNRKKIPLP